MVCLVLVWERLSLDGRTDLYVLPNGTFTAVGYWNEILRAIVTGAVGTGFLLVHDNTRSSVTARVCSKAK